MTPAPQNDVAQPGSRKSVVVIGGGVAGIAAACALADEGFKVELIEKRPLLGGRASSHTDPHTGQLIDECQHGTMRCCTNLSNLLNRIGASEQIRYHGVIRFLDEEGRRSVIANCGLPAPLHTSLSFLTFRSLGTRDKLCIARGLFAMLRGATNADLDRTDTLTWLKQLHQTDRAVKRFWSPILVSACNETLDRICCRHAFKIFRDGFLLNSQAFHFGVPCVPLGTLFTEPAISYITARGGNVRLKSIVDKVDVTASDPITIQGITLQNGESLTADYYICALQSDLLLKLLPASMTGIDPYWEGIRHIELSPIIGVHLWFDRVIECPEALALLDRETEWIFNKTLNFDDESASGTYLSAVISASRRYAEVSREDILARVLADVHESLPETRNSRLLHSAVVKWPKATFSPLTGIEELRPFQASPVPNLFLAGEWTNTGWPSTMESAAISGYRAAECILWCEGDYHQIEVPGLPAGRLARLFAGRRKL
jgi:squalene-associated FAD-dependent desaturase